jgi:hypothetical protein
MEDAMKYWPLDETEAYIVEQIRRYKPSVIVTHDTKGEYVHGAHILTSYATQLAFKDAGNPSKFPDSAKKYGTWNAGKLYIHLYSKNKLNTMDLNKRLSSMGGRSVLQVISDAYSRQKSQLPGRSLPTSGDYDMRKFGLFDTNLGWDTTGTSMYEHVSKQAMLDINPAVAADETALLSALEKAKALSEADYTPESWAEANLPAVIAQAQAVADDQIPTQAQVDAQTAALNAAMGKLVLKPTLQSLEITHPADKLSYTVGESLNLTGLVVEGLYSDASRKAMAFTTSNVTGFDSAAPVTGQVLTLSLEGKSVTFTVDIVAPEPTLTGISVTTPPDKLTYTVGESLDLTGLVVTASYSDSTSAAVTAYTTDPTNGATLSTAGAVTVTVTYKEGDVTKTATFSVTVNAAT